MSNDISDGAAPEIRDRPKPRLVTKDRPAPTQIDADPFSRRNSQSCADKKDISKVALPPAPSASNDVANGAAPEIRDRPKPRLVKKDRPVATQVDVEPFSLRRCPADVQVSTGDANDSHVPAASADVSVGDSRIGQPVSS